MRNHGKFLIGFILIFLIVSGANSRMGEAPGEEVAFGNAGVHEYNLPAGASVALKAVVKPGQTLSTILLSHHVPYETIHALALKSRGIFDLRKMRAGNAYLLVKGSNSDTHPSYLVYEQDPVNYLLFKLEEPVGVYKGRKEVKIRVRELSGVIDNSLAESLGNEQFADELALKLSEIYAWSIDFYHLQKGDHFKVIFEEEQLGNHPVGLGKILAARMHHRAHDYYAFYFEQDLRGRYFDENGRSVEKAFLKCPLRYARISSRFSKRRLHPILKKPRPHLGVDYAAPTGTPIMSVGDGLISECAHKEDCGKYVTVRHNHLYSTQYFHMSRIARGMKPGVRVKQGDIIGYVGSTGLATGPHVEFRLLKNGDPVNPLKEEMPPSEPVRDENLEAFRDRVAELRKSLDAVEVAEVL